MLYVAILDDDVADCNALLPDVVIQNTWITIVATYGSKSKTLELRVGSASISTVCTTARLDRVVSRTYVGRSNWPLDAYSQGSIAGLYAVDQLLSDSEISKITSEMYQGEDTLQACETCPANTWSLQGSMSVADCFDKQSDSILIPGESQRTCTVCDANAISPGGSISSASCSCVAGYTGESHSCVPCAVGKYKTHTGADACVDCPVDSQSPNASSTATACLCNVGFTGENGDTCEMCAVGKYKDQSGPIECFSCPSNSNSPQQSAVITACACNAGYSGEDGSGCSECGAGTYQSVNSTSNNCSLCADNSNSLPTSDSVLACLCNAGYSGMNGGNCSACLAGTYKNNTGSSDCINCVAGQYSAEIGATSNVCINCVAGTFSNNVAANDITTCQDCVAGSYTTYDTAI